MAAKLRVIPASAEAFEVPIQNTATIGRTAENSVCLSFSPTVSRQHAVIRCHNGFEYQVMDLGSRNGTYVNDQRVVMPVTLKNGSKIRIANNEMIFEVVEET
ncbi:MAG: FHA domain-containing protein, partial [Verrucomicrobia bacterium]|nr:FHA domain-containing protein [Verrucomicrobiota bacterium]